MAQLDTEEKHPDTEKKQLGVGANWLSKKLSLVGIDASTETTH